MPRGSYLEIDEKIDGERRQVEFRPGSGGQPEIEYRRNGKSAPFDTDAQEWLAVMIPQIFRMSAYQAEARVERLLAAGGVDAVLDEVRLIGGDYSQRIYMVHLIEKAQMTAAETRAWIETAGTEIGSDYELAETLGRVDTTDLSQADVQKAFVAAATSIGSDYELRRTLQRLLTQRAVSPDVLTPLLESASSIGSDYECAELLIAIANKYPDGQALPVAYYEVAASIGSDYEMRRALAEFSGRPLDGESLSHVLSAATDIGSDYELAELLVQLISEQGVPEGSRDAYKEAIGTIGSSYERQRVEAAWGRAH